jgi:hypothetical protein
MKIISKYKDYYDYLQGIYGVDEKLVLDRTKGTPGKFQLSSGFYQLVICGRVIEFVSKNGKTYSGEQLEEISEKDFEWGSYLGPRPIYKIQHTWGIIDYYKVYYPKLSYDNLNIYPWINQYIKQYPIFIMYGKQLAWVFPNLSDIGINKQVDAKEIWVMLSEWLAERITEKEPSVPIGDDKTRILSHGFDLKTSFRNTKK